MSHVIGSSRSGIERLEPRLLLSESVQTRIDVNGLVSAGRAAVTATPSDIGTVRDIFDDNNSSLYRTPNIDPIVVEVSFTAPKTVQEFRVRFSHASSHRWKVEASGGSYPAPPAYTEIVPWTSAGDSVDSVRRLASPVNVQRLRLTGERLVGDNYVHLNEWRIIGDLTINSLSVVPASLSLRQYEQRRLRADAIDADGIVHDFSARVGWSSGGEAVATVDGTGLVRGASPGSTIITATLGTLTDTSNVTVTPAGQRDLNVTYIERTPRYNYDSVKKNPAPGDVVTFHGHIRNWDYLTPAANYRWELDGVPVASGTLTDLGANEERVVTWQWAWQNGPHRVRLVVDPENVVTEFSEVNNAVEDRTDGVIVGFWVEQSLYDYFHTRQRDLGIGSNSWEDWAQRQMAKWNEHNAVSVWDVTPNGVTDRVRIDKIVVVPDGALPLNGGLPSNNPDSRDKTVDMMWGFEWDPTSTFYSNTTSRDPNNPFYLEPSLRHEMGHARYLIDNYTFDVANNSSVTQVQIVEPTTGQPVAGTTLMPYLAFNSVLYYNQSGGMMTGPYGNNVWSPHEAGALQRIAGRRAVSGNMNAPGNIGEFLNDLPLRNHVRFVNGTGQPLAGADVRWYAAGPGPGYGGKTFDTTPEYTLTADADGYVHLPRDPFVPGQMREAVIRIAHGGQVWYRFFEVAEMNLEYWRGHTQDGYYTVELPLRTAAAEIEVQGKNTIIADGDTTPSRDDLTDFGQAFVNERDLDGYVIRTFVVRNRGGLPLTVSPAVSITGPNSSDFTVEYRPADRLTSQTLTVFQVKFDPRAAGVRTATVSLSNGDGNENPYNFAIRGTGVLVSSGQVFGLAYDDRDGDGTRDDGEPPLPDRTVFADSDEDGVLDAGEISAVTDAAGRYELNGLPNDRVSRIVQVPRAGWRQTEPAAGFHTYNPFIDVVQSPMNFGNARVVVGRYVFYNNSAFDNRDPVANAADDAAIAPDKAALLPGGTPAFQNVTNYSKGINGVMIDIGSLPDGDVPAAEDFGWGDAPPPSDISLRRGAGVSGTDRITLTWADGRVRNRWLNLSVLPSERTGLAAADAFSFGNLVGEVGNDSSPLTVSPVDVALTRRAMAARTADLLSRYDHNRDGRIDVFDLRLVRANVGESLPPFADQAESTLLRSLTRLGVETPTALLRLKVGPQDLITSP